MDNLRFDQITDDYPYSFRHFIYSIKKKTLGDETENTLLIINHQKYFSLISTIKGEDQTKISLAIDQEGQPSATL